MTHVARSLLRPRSSRTAWCVSPLEVGRDGLLGPSALISRAVDVASAMTDAPPSAVAIHDLKVVAPVRAGDELLVTAALEREDALASVVSVVMRAGERSVVALGTLRLQRAAPEACGRARGDVATGKTLVEALFRADRAEALGGTAGRWLQDTALVSAQGFAGPAAFDAVVALTVLGKVEVGQALSLQCSVVHAEASRVTVLTHVRDELSGSDVLCALTSWRVARPLVAERWFGAARGGR